jgi:adenylate cyclase
MVRTPPAFFNLGRLFPALVLLACVLLLLWDPAPLKVVLNTGFDTYQRWLPRERDASLVQVVDIDDQSLRLLGQWPWPRTRLASLVYAIHAAGARAIVFDMVFSESDRTSPVAMSKLWYAAPDLAEQLQKLPDHDDAFGQAIATSQRVVLGSVLGPSSTDGSGSEPVPVGQARFQTTPDAMHAPFLSFPQQLGNVAVLARSAAGTGALNFLPDADGVVRRVPLVLRYQNGLQPSLALEALRVAQAESVVRVFTTGRDAVDRIEVGSHAMQTDAQGALWIYYAQAEKSRALPAWLVLAGEVPVSALAGKVVLIGASAQGLMDVRFTSQGSMEPGVEIQAQIIEQMLQGRLLTRASWSLLLEGLVLLGLGVFTIRVTLRHGALRSAMVISASLALLCALSWWSFSRWGLLLDAAIPGALVLVVFVCASVVRHLEVENEQTWIRDAFASYISPNLVQHLVDHPQALTLSGKRQMCSFVFTDIANFTSLIEQESPEQAISAVNRYIDGMVAIAFAHQGTLDRIVGDSLAFVFSAPIEQADHAARALRCALDLHHFARQFSVQEHAKGLPFGKTRIAAHTGAVVVGNFGGSNILDYRALGDPVNTAARMESANKIFNTSVCISEDLLRASGSGIAARPIAQVVLKGKTQSLALFEPMDAIPAGQAAPLETYLEAYALLASGAQEALPALVRLAQTYPQDTLIRYHLERMRDGVIGDRIVLEMK